MKDYPEIPRKDFTPEYLASPAWGPAALHADQEMMIWPVAERDRAGAELAAPVPSVQSILSVLDAVDAAYPHLLRKNDHAADTEYCQRVLLALPVPEHWGHLSKSNGENGFTFPNGVRVSHDAIALPSKERFDIIGGSDATTPATPTWNPIPPQFWRPSNVWTPQQPLLGTAGAITPPEPPKPPQPPQPPAVRLPGPDEAMAFAQWLDAFYMAPEGLQRPNGASIGGRPDWEAVGAWMFGVWLRVRVSGASEVDARAQVVREIQQSAEWRSKHP